MPYPPSSRAGSCPHAGPGAAPHPDSRGSIESAFQEPVEAVPRGMAIGRTSSAAI